MDIKDMTMEDIEKRYAEINVEMDKPEADIDALTEEVRNLKERKTELEKAAEKRRKLKADVS